MGLNPLSFSAAVFVISGHIQEFNKATDAGPASTVETNPSPSHYLKLLSSPFTINLNNFKHIS